jgi:hypothetical protein
MAYFVLPRYVFNQPEKVSAELSAGRVGAMFFYVLTCTFSEKEPDPEVAKAFAAHTGTLDDRHNYYVIEYPIPAPVDITGVADDRMLEALQQVVLAPYFSAMIEDRQSKQVRYFILGQSPDGHTTLRAVTPEFNANLGPGCEPELQAFLGLLRERIASGET